MQIRLLEIQYYNQMIIKKIIKKKDKKNTKLYYCTDNFIYYFYS